MLRRLGFCPLRFRYVQPALSETQSNCTTLLLTVHESFLAGGDASFPGPVLLAFLREFFAVLLGEEAMQRDPDYTETQRALAGVRTVAVEL